MRKFQEGVADGFLVRASQDAPPLNPPQILLSVTKVECIRRLLESEPLRSACENARA